MRRLTISVLAALATAMAVVVVVLPTDEASSSEEPAVRAAIDRYMRALATGDAVAVCASITPDSRRAVAALGDGVCETTVAPTLVDARELLADQGVTQRLTIGDDVATGVRRYPSLLTTERITIRRQRGRWLMDVHEQLLAPPPT